MAYKHLEELENFQLFWIKKTDKGIITSYSDYMFK